MKSRRDFLKNAAVGAVLLSSKGKLGLAAVVDPHTAAGKSKVVIAHDAALRSANGQLDEKRIPALLDRAIAAYTGRDKPIEAWKRIVPVGKIIGLKVNGRGGKGLSTHLALVLAICERLQQAGVKPGEIVVWDCIERDILACGLTISTDSNRIRCYGSDLAGFDEQTVVFGTVKVNLSKILSRQCDFVINLPVLKDHYMTGVTFSMKNMYGAIQQPNELHANGCNPAIADLNCIPAIRQKVRFIIGDAITSMYEGGPRFKPEFLWQPNALIIGEDRVAVDTTALQMLECKRSEAGLQTFEAAGRPSRYIATAADATHNLGTNDPKHIRLMEV